MLAREHEANEAWLAARKAAREDALKHEQERKHRVGARARGGKSAPRQARDEVILEVGRALREKHPDKRADWLAPRAHVQVNDRLRTENRRRKEAAQHSSPPTVAKLLKLPRESTVYSWVRENWARIAPPK
jgi:hypothetical protein